MNNSHTITIDGSKINSYESFHQVFKEAFGFLDGYGMNMNAWIDCMGDIHEDTGMMKVTLNRDVSLIIEIQNTGHIKDSNPEILEALASCTAFVNKERIKHLDPQQAPIYLLFWN